MKTKADYEGTYYIARTPRSLKSHNAVSWAKIETLASQKPDGKMDFDHISLVVKDHEHGTKSANHPYQFVTYCIRSGWLERV